jgi:hypothetical protein
MMASKTRRVSSRVRCDEYDGERRDMVSVRLRVTESVERCTIRRHEYDIIEDDSGEENGEQVPETDRE